MQVQNSAPQKGQHFAKKQVAKPTAKQHAQAKGKGQENEQRGEQKVFLPRIFPKKSSPHRKGKSAQHVKPAKPVENRGRNSRSNRFLGILVYIVNLFQISANIARHKIVEKRTDKIKF
jgi:hypothetical protein